MKENTRHIIKKLVVAFLIAAVSFPVSFYFLNKVPLNGQKNLIEVEYGSETFVIPQIELKLRQKSILKTDINKVDSADARYIASYSLESLTPEMRIALTFSSGSEVTIYSVSFINGRIRNKLKGEHLLRFAKAVEATKVKKESAGLVLSSKTQTKKIISTAFVHGMFQVLKYKRTALWSSFIAIFFFVAIALFPFQWYINHSADKLVLSCLFIIIISSPFLIRVQGLDNFEKRLLKKKPLLTQDNAFSYHREFGNYFEDNFGFRDYLIRWHNSLKIKLFGATPIPDRVILGKDNWLFLAAENNSDFITNNQLYTPAELEKINKNLTNIERWLTDRGIKFYLVVPPIKSRVYPDKLPDQLVKVNKESKIDQVKDYLSKHSDIEVIYPLDKLIDGRSVQETYWWNDTHWTFYGAFLSFQELLKEMQKDFEAIDTLNIDFFEKREVYHIGDLGQMLGVNDFMYSKDIKLELKGKKPFTITSPFKKHTDPDFLFPGTLTENSDTTLPSVVFFHDSFSNYYFEFSGEKFNRSLYLWTHKFKPGIIEEEKPDAVVFEVLERFLDDLVLDTEYD